MRNPIQLLKDSIDIFNDNVGLFLGILIVPLILSVGAALFEPPQDTGVVDTMEWIMFISLTVLATIVNIFMGIALILAVNNRALTVGETYKTSAPIFWSYIGLSILSSIVIMIGFILLVIPGIILSVWFAFAAIVLVLERAGIVESMKKSKEYVKGKWWGVFGRLVAGSLIALVVLGGLSALVVALPIELWAENMIITAISMLVAPIMVAYIYLMYQDLKGAPVAAPAFAPESAVTPDQTTTV